MKILNHGEHGGHGVFQIRVSSVYSVVKKGFLK
jgi:hypothetical protein